MYAASASDAKSPQRERPNAGMILRDKDSRVNRDKPEGLGFRPESLPTHDREGARARDSEIACSGEGDSAQKTHEEVKCA